MFCSVGNPLAFEFPVPAYTYSPIGSVRKVLACPCFLLDLGRSPDTEEEHLSVVVDNATETTTDLQTAHTLAMLSSGWKDHISSL